MIWFPNTLGLLQYSVTLTAIDSDTSADNLVKRTTNCELQNAVQQVSTTTMICMYNTLSFIPLCLIEAPHIFLSNHHHNIIATNSYWEVHLPTSIEIIQFF